MMSVDRQSEHLHGYGATKILPVESSVQDKSDFNKRAKDTRLCALKHTE